ncbi:MAG: amidohydrolase family protein [Rhodanobacter sp.]
MALLVEHRGFTPIEAIRAATQVSAAAMGQSAQRGTIAAGKRAELRCRSCSNRLRSK